MIDRTREDIIQDQHIADLKARIDHLEEVVRGLDSGLRNAHVRIDRMVSLPQLPPLPPPVLNFWSFVLRLFKKG